MSLDVLPDSLVDVRGVGGVAARRGSVVFLLDSSEVRVSLTFSIKFGIGLLPGS